jgi:hypothetical protein
MTESIFFSSRILIDFEWLIEARIFLEYFFWLFIRIHFLKFADTNLKPVDLLLKIMLLPLDPLKIKKLSIFPLLNTIQS